MAKYSYRDLGAAASRASMKDVSDAYFEAYVKGTVAAIAPEVTAKLMAALDEAARNEWDGTGVPGANGVKGHGVTDCTLRPNVSPGPPHEGVTDDHARGSAAYSSYTPGRAV